jgi:hypothetical protein
MTIKSPDLLRGLTPREVKVLQLRSAIKVRSASQTETTKQTQEFFCSVCGKKSMHIRGSYNGKQFLTICTECAVLKSDDE